MVFDWCPCDSKSFHISKSLLSIPVDPNNALICLVSIRPLISMSSGPRTMHWWVYQKQRLQLVSPSLSYSIVFFWSFANSRYLSLFSPSFSLTLWTARTAKTAIWQLVFQTIVSWWSFIGVWVTASSLWFPGLF